MDILNVKRGTSMKKKTIYIFLTMALIIFSVFCWSYKSNKVSSIEPIKHVTGTILKCEDDMITLEDAEENLFNFDKDKIDEKIGTEVKVEYKEKGESSREVIDYEVINESEIPSSWLDDGIFKDYYVRAYKTLSKMSLDEKIGQLLLARYPEENGVGDVQKYHLGGFVFYEVDFKGKSKETVINMIKEVQDKSKIPLLTAIDEEGGRVSRLSSNKNLVDTPFKSPQNLLKLGGWTAIEEDVKNKSIVLKGLGLNLNLAPVVDVSTDSNYYMFDRTIGLDAEGTATYAKKVIEASRGTGVSYTLKHFPGYGNNADTHLSGSVDNKSKDRIMIEDIPPFKTGIESGAEAVMVAHNVVSSIDKNEASLSKPIHNLLRDELKFTGIIMTDDISMGALKDIPDTSVRAIEAGNDILITTDYIKSFDEIKEAIQNGRLDKDSIERKVFRILAWKYYKGIM